MLFQALLSGSIKAITGGSIRAIIDSLRQLLFLRRTNRPPREQTGWARRHPFNPLNALSGALDGKEIKERGCLAHWGGTRGNGRVLLNQS
jgi:hypothetical protein